MFEGKPPKAHKTPQAFGFGAADSPAESGVDALHTLSWSDLRARLEAARDLRAAMLAQAEEPHASFDSHCARRLADLAEGKDAVNPDDLANGKGTGCIDVPSPDDGTCSPRGNT